MAFDKSNWAVPKDQAEWLRIFEQQKEYWSQRGRRQWKDDRLNGYAELIGCPEWRPGTKSPAGATVTICFPVLDPHVRDTAWVGIGELVKYCKVDLEDAARLLAACGRE